MKQFKDVLRAKRKALNLTQYELADIIGTSQNIVTKWETGRFFPGFLYLADLADFFQCSVDELMGREQKP
ncbi:MAG: helix-turn-helix transcriptional regulator [Clostridia bacterium]|nr:helix-turn-helix transcriptional regulator [Clostridia bacterium]